MVTLLKSYFNVTIWSNIEKIFNIANIVAYETDDSIGCVVGCMMLGIVILTSGITPIFTLLGGPSLFVEFVKNVVLQLRCFSMEMVCQQAWFNFIRRSGYSSA